MGAPYLFYISHDSTVEVCECVDCDGDTVSAENRADGPVSDTLGDMSSDPGENDSLDSC